MRKTFMGVQLRRLREERGMTQVALARALGLSASYLNQIEQNQRPLTVPVLLKLNAVFGLDVQLFAEAEEARLVADLRAVLSEQGPGAALAEVREIAGNMPAVARAILALHRGAREANERADALAARLGAGAGTGVTTPAPFEEVRDFFFARRNYLASLDTAAERLADEAALPVGRMAEGLAARLSAQHGVRIEEAASGTLRAWDPASRVLRLSPRISLGQRAFQMATQLAFLECGGIIDTLAGEAEFRSAEADRLVRTGLANYFAGALLMPYGAFLDAAEAVGYDIDLLGRRFGVGFETTCHRLSTLQRPEARGVPFFFIRTDRAGNISKRQSATDFHFSRIGGNCPLWTIYAAFARPGEILTQIAQMPDGRSYLWIARTVTRSTGGFGAPAKTFAIAMGCDLRHADRLVYSRGLDLRDPAAATPIGAGCRICDRPACPQRAFPPSGRPLAADAGVSRFAPYSAG
jgi:predicted transcriptional regulator/plasmid maintenance system antidote protein VapI